MTTLSDVAQRAAVSEATASRAFSRPESVRVDTRDRSRTVARDPGYSQQLTGRGVRVGVEVTVTAPPLTTIAVPGAAAVRLLGELIRHGVPDPVPTQQLPTELAVRRSTGPAPA